MLKTDKTLDEEASRVGLRYVGGYAGIMRKIEYICPVHGSILQVPNKVQQGIGCQKCGRESQYENHKIEVDIIVEEAHRAGLTFVGPYTRLVDPTYYDCPHHGRIKMRPTVIRRGGGCRQCGIIAGGLKRRVVKPPRILKRQSKTPIDELFDQAKAVGLTYADGYVTSNGSARYICPTHGEIQMRPVVVRKGGGCRFCSGNVQKSAEQLAAEAEKIELRFIGPVVSDKVLTEYECPHHGRILKRPGDVRGGKRCSSCVTAGPDATAPCVFYLYDVEPLEGRPFVGYGITKNHKRRDGAHRASFKKKGAVASLISLYDLPTGRDGLDLEMHVWREMREHHVETEIQGFLSEAVQRSAKGKLVDLVVNWLTEKGVPY